MEGVHPYQKRSASACTGLLELVSEVHAPLRACLVSGSAGEHEGFYWRQSGFALVSIQRRTIFEVRTGRTGRKNGHRWVEKTRA